MKIALIAPEFPPRIGGMERLAYGLANALGEKLGSENVLVVSEPTDASAHHVDTSKFGLLRSHSRSQRSTAEELRSTGALDSVDTVLGLNAALAPMARFLPCPLSIYVHGNDLLRPWLACGPGLIEAFERPYLPRFRHALRRRSIRRALPELDQIFTNSSNTATLVRQLGAMEHVRVVSPGVDDIFFQRSDEDSQAESGEALELLTVTRLSSSTRRKNVDGLIRAVSLLPDSLPVRLSIVGDGDDRERLESIARELDQRRDQRKRVHFLGSLDQAELLAAYRKADLFILASLASERDVEGFGIVYLEASAAGVPSLCSREGGATDAVVDGENGWLIEDSSPRTIADAIERFAHQRSSIDPDRISAVAERYRWPKVAQRIVDALDPSL